MFRRKKAEPVVTDGEPRVGTPATADAFEARGISGTVLVNRKSYAVGLLWDFPRGDVAGMKPAKEALRRATGAGTNLYGVRRDGSQFAVGSSTVGHANGMYALATTLHATLGGGSFLGVFPVDDGGWYLVAHNESVLPNTDVVLPSLEDAQQLFVPLQTGFDWDATFCPSDWNIANSRADPLDAILAIGLRHDIRLQRTSNARQYMVLAGAVAVGLAALFGYQYWAEHAEIERLRQEAAELEAKAIADRQAAERARQNIRVVIPDYVWTNRPVGQNALAACVEAILAAPIDLPGWNPTAVSCNSDGILSVQARRETGTLNWVEDRMRRTGLPFQIVREGTGGSADVRIRLPEFAESLPKLPNNAPTQGVEPADLYLGSHFDEIGQAWTRRVQDTNPVQIANPQNPSQPISVRLSRSLDMEFQVRMDPLEYMEILAPLQAVTLRAVTLNLSDWTWRVQMSVHERLTDAEQIRRQVLETRPVGPAAGGRR